MKCLIKFVNAITTADLARGLRCNFKHLLNPVTFTVLGANYSNELQLEL